MKLIGPAKLLATACLFVACLLAIVHLNTHRVVAAPPQLPMNGGQGFLGQGCAQGDHTKRCSISANGPFFSLTNEQGSTSSGHLQGMNSNVIVADQWQFVQGMLSPDGTQIHWSNGTCWARCNGGGGGGGGGDRHHGPNLQGTWYRDGNHSRACSIDQRGNNLAFTNEQAVTAQGKFLGNKNVTANWNGQTINGTLVKNGRPDQLGTTRNHVEPLTPTRAPLLLNRASTKLQRSLRRAEVPRNLCLAHAHRGDQYA